MMRKAVFLIIFVFLSFGVFALNASADGVGDDLSMPDEYGGFIDSVPDGVLDTLPDGFRGENAEGLEQGLLEITDPKKLLGLVFDGIFVGISDITPTLATSIGILLISSVINLVSPISQMSSSMRLISRLCITAIVLNLVFSSISIVGEYFSSLCYVAEAYIPLSAVLYAWGGNVSTAVATTASFGVCLSVCQFIFSYTAIPIFVFCASMTVVSCFDGGGIVSSIAGSVRKYYLLILSFVMTTLGVCITSQTFISAKADGVAMRGAKLVVGNFVPISGGTISSSLGAIASGVELIRGCVGIGGIIITLMMLLPVITHLAVMRLFFFVLDMFAFSVGDGKETVSQLGELYSYLLGVASVSSVIFVLMFATLGFCSAAVR